MEQVATIPQRNILSRLWNDKESRSVIIQIATISLVFAFFAYIINNAIVNLQAIGKGFSYDFLWQPSSYDINQHLIEYDSRSPHFRAMLVGILNTLLIASCGIVLATVLGFILGVLRLSKNWLVNRLAYCYIEFVRNVPVLLHILLVHGIIVHSFPVPKQAVSVNDVAFMTNRGIFSAKPIFEPLFLAVIALFVLGIAFMFWFRRYAKNVQDETGHRYPVFWIGLASIVGVPLVVFFILGSPITWDVPELKGFNFRGGMVIRPEFIALLLALSLYTAAFIGEIVRAGIQGVNYGQTEASYALGINRGRTLSLVI
ncbi:MAG: ABC transporter permease subunit, partial [Gammaproteobacteria bacterium]|nr:ABC transporter permease subunit [Gammaproteobacteria bacterium]